ncbi:GntR family transcriptional regulator [Sporosarcina sp. P37]|uniref:FadR/GntR family transcriptional regulator n=1 Tax=unclassified Sporosarcina TaxID=2647733 RepID=UPI0009C10C9B|nr:MULTISPECIES: GntR family transcriptional regulator [unclassified Sporosarcina]ARD47190.1 GntR family transcriptional regulator [Sporosarcina sp. P33]ARK23757.1 GntR family transcriptional regulator [Sporosarcina sp. P37]PID18903.1 FadR family transcriptional regulator [Sporosarcina sp. P35]
MQNSQSSSKRFLDIIGELQSLISEQKIEYGDKLPSERHLAEKLQVSRTAVREALRSMELLGLIETRRGEGTFLSDFKKHQLVEVLSAFIMQQARSIQDVVETRMIHERAAITAVTKNEELRMLPVWRGMQSKLNEEEAMFLREDMVRETIVATENRLSLKIWFLLKQYSGVSFDVAITDPDEIMTVRELLGEMMAGNTEQALACYEQWMNQVEGERRETE